MLELVHTEDRDHVKLYNTGPMTPIPAYEDLVKWIDRNPTAMKSYTSRYRAHQVASILSEEVASIHEATSPAMYTIIKYDERYYPVIFVTELVKRSESVAKDKSVARQGFMQV